ncbi:ABC transporter ATP-binding protein [Burkholderia pseudomultivorans]|uniref:Teichoic acids export ATP-binding protein TagH n=1 Tax=Burkholderia pseudomultivorans TaxID=1207504 RepID=A0ABU2E809_9BURK|nr:ABC transporter ATP-binding protein [Burkholderia pseudomultivorans]MDR8731965.1 Teichoic acids export ATP-binding protein TagH [Burkholderia pseudomultivorans]MDR8737973.1 Teichoic acids export ATP-binding protein TagH [Burkholderia pseudomultivorans]MDR8744325.1 Teichoic acids export ATP-binding protein TagH [Burkholderia pseudomultivorans]MDR8756005.1 Teichoic acids export ATP-binding protein TagH [Burkholderia pseudomultivorans]MDR8780691.1 Teichoic acids export ATP-binding protein TagH
MAYIELKNVTLDLPIYDVQGRSLKKQVLRMGRRNRIAEGNDGVIVVRALDDLSFRFERGDRVGLIGHNGAGKSTLLRAMAGIYPPTTGTLSREGKAVPLLDISLGMDENSTGMQNIRLRGLLLGMSDAEIREKQSDIAAFSELGDYLDLPIRTYSSGMKMRLAFAVSTSVDAEILLLDEVMGVGDASFMHKAEARLEELHDRAEIVVLAMHSNKEIRKVCNKALWMERGRVRAFGEVDDVVSQYAASVGE